MMVPSQGRRRVESWFLIPLVRNGDRQLHAPEVWGLLRAEIFAVAHGWTGPEEIRKVPLIETVKTLPGGWKDPASGRVITDETRKYTVLVPEDDVEELRAVLGRAANSFDQEEILFIVHGVDQSVRRRIEDGLLKGHIWTP